MFKYLVILFLLQVNCNQHKRVEKENFVEFFAYTESDTTVLFEGMYESRTRRFIVENFNDYNDTLYKNFAVKKINEVDSPFRYVFIFFYKKSNITNIEHLTKSPRDVDRYSQDNDMIYEFNGSTVNKNIYMTKYKKGEVISRRDASIRME